MGPLVPGNWKDTGVKVGCTVLITSTQMAAVRLIAKKGGVPAPVVFSAQAGGKLRREGVEIGGHKYLWVPEASTPPKTPAVRAENAARSWDPVARNYHDGTYGRFVRIAADTVLVEPGLLVDHGYLEYLLPIGSGDKTLVTYVDDEGWTHATRWEL